MSGGRPVLDCIMHKLPSTRKYYRVTLIVPDTGIPIIQYHQASGSKKPKKFIQFVDLLFADKKHDTNEKFAFSVYTTCKTTTFLAQDETTMNEWLTKIREFHAALYPEFKRYDAIFEASMLEEGLAKTMNIKGLYRLALCKESLDLIPMLTAASIEQHQTTFNRASSIANDTTATTNTTSTTNNNNNSAQHQSISNHNDHNHHHQHHQHHHNHHDGKAAKLPNFQYLLSYIQHPHHHLNPSHHFPTSFGGPLNPNTSITPHSNHHPHLPQHVPNHQRFCKRHPLLMSKTIELVLRSIRRCGHRDSKFFIESGRHSQIGEGGLWLTLNKKATARQLHELLLAAMKSASSVEDQYLYKAPRSRSGSSSENAHRLQPLGGPQSQQPIVAQPQLEVQAARISSLLFTSNHKEVEEDSGYLPMA